MQVLRGVAHNTFLRHSTCVLRYGRAGKLGLYSGPEELRPLLNTLPPRLLPHLNAPPSPTCTTQRAAYRHTSAHVRPGVRLPPPEAVLLLLLLLLLLFASVPLLLLLLQLLLPLLLQLLRRAMAAP